ncbi:MAG: MFS transporter [Phycisphaerales bacterium]
MSEREVGGPGGGTGGGVGVRAGRGLRAARGAVLSFTPGAMPPLAARNYRYELLGSFYLPFLLAVVDSTIISVVAKNAFAHVVSDGALNMVVAVLTASTSFANIVSFVWVRLAHGRDKVRFINGLQVAMIALVALIGAVPRTGHGLVGLVALVLMARFCWAGFITIRTTVWRQNYSRELRARLTGKLATIQVVSVAVLGFGLGMAMDLDDRAFRVFFPAGAALALAGVWAWSRVRVRQGPALIESERRNGTGEQGPSISPVSLVRLLAQDRKYAAYMGCMMLLGLGNLMVSPVLVIALRDLFKMEYLGGIVIANSLPLAMMPISIPFWAKLLDRVHVIEFRAIHCWFFVAASTIVTVAGVTRSPGLLYVSAVIQGLAFGGGVLAWNLGHLDFAPAHRASEYMGAHVTLTGLRGLIAPFLAVGLWKGLEYVHPGAGAWTFAFCAGLSAIGGLGFVRLQALRRRELAADPEKRAEARAEGPAVERAR